MLLNINILIMRSIHIIKNVIIIFCISIAFLSSKLLSQNTIDQERVRAFNKWCQSLGPNAQLSSDLVAYRYDRCACKVDTMQMDGMCFKGHDIEALMSSDRTKVEDAGELLAAMSTEMDGHQAIVAVPPYDMLGTVIATASWSKPGTYYSIKYTEGYCQGSIPETAIQAAERKVLDLGTTLNRSNGGGGFDPGSRPGNTQNRPTQSGPGSSQSEQQGDSASTNSDENREPPKTHFPQGPGVPDAGRSPQMPRMPDKDGQTRIPRDQGPVNLPDDAAGLHTGMRLGIMGGLTYSGLAYDFGDGFEMNELQKIGYFAGLLIDFQFNNFSIQLPITYKIKGEEIDVSYLFDASHQFQGSADETFASGSIIHELQYIEIPLVFNVGFSTGKNFLSFGAGPYVAKGIGGSEMNDYEVSYYDNGVLQFTDNVFGERNIQFSGAGELSDFDTKYLNSWDYGIYGQVTFQMGNLVIGGSLSYGLADINTSDDWTSQFGALLIPEVRTVSASLVIAYYL